MTRHLSIFITASFALLLVACVNPADDMKELRENPQGDLAQRTMILTLPDGESIPVNYVREDGFVFTGADGRWWRQLRGDGAPVMLLIKGDDLKGKARAVEGDRARARYILERVRPGFAWITPSIPIEIALSE